MGKCRGPYEFFSLRGKCIFGTPYWLRRLSWIGVWIFHFLDKICKTQLISTNLKTRLDCTINMAARLCPKSQNLATIPPETIVWSDFFWHKYVNDEITTKFSGINSILETLTYLFQFRVKDYNPFLPVFGSHVQESDSFFPVCSTLVWDHINLMVARESTPFIL